ncbi:MAG: P1 family peptidase [Actinomycetota bacterium]
MSTLPEGFTAGHWTAPDASTGCTVLLPPIGNVCGVDVRGSAPGSRELESLHARRAREEVHGIVLAGASAFGLAVADGVMRWLEERGIGFHAASATIPIVPAAVIFDAAAFPGSVRPNAESGYRACEMASREIERGRVGVGAGATVGKWSGREHLAPGGIGFATLTEDAIEVSALAVANAFGDVIDEDGSVLAGSRAEHPMFAPPSSTNTVLAIVMCNAPLSKQEATFIAARGSDGITKSVRPAHTRFDGDIVFAVAVPKLASDPFTTDRIGMLATQAVATAVRDAVRAD